MRKFLAALLVAGFGIFCLSVADTAGQHSEQELRALVPKIVAFWETFDLSKIEPYYATDADLAFFDLAPLKYNNWAEYRVTVPKVLFEPNSSLQLKVNDDLHVHVRGANFAWATVTFGADSTSKQGAASHLDGRWTMILEKRAKGWTVVHEHVSVPSAVLDAVTPVLPGSLPVYAIWPKSRQRILWC